MRRSLIALASGLLLAVALAVPAFASEEMCESGRMFGAMHAAEAQAGALGKGMNPGVHHGFSHCVR